LALLYCVALCSSEESILFEEFKVLCDNHKIFIDLVRSFKKECEKIAQFQEFLENKDTNAEPEYFGKFINTLIIKGGLDIWYTYERLELEDIPDLFRTIDEIEKSKLEHQRLWTYISILPISTEKDQIPSRLMPAMGRSQYPQKSQK
jgi:hypothetical protein